MFRPSERDRFGAPPPASRGCSDGILIGIRGATPRAPCASQTWLCSRIARWAPACRRLVAPLRALLLPTALHIPTEDGFVSPNDAAS